MSLDESVLSLKLRSLYLCFVSTEIHSLRVITVTVYFELLNMAKVEWKALLFCC